MSAQGAPVRIAITISVRWWFAPYIHVLGFAAWLMCAEPDWDKLADLIVRRGIRIDQKVL